MAGSQRVLQFCFVFYLFAAIICKHYISRRRNLCVKHTVVTHQRRRRRHTIQL